MDSRVPLEFDSFVIVYEPLPTALKRIPMKETMMKL